MKKKSLIIGIISLVVLLFVAGNNVYDIIRFSEDDIISWYYEGAGYMLALILSLIAFVLAMISIIKNEKLTTNDKKILVAVYIVSVIFMIVCVIENYAIRLFGFIAILLGFLKICSVKGEISEKIKLIIATTLSVILIHESFLAFMQIAWSLDEYKNSTRLEHYDSSENSLVKYDYDYVSARQTMAKYNEVNKALNDIVKKYNKENKTNISKSDFIKYHCKTNEVVTITTNKDAYDVVYGEIKEVMAFGDDNIEYYKIDFEDEFYGFVQRYKINTNMFLTSEKTYLENIVTDKNGTIYINPSSFLKSII